MVSMVSMTTMATTSTTTTTVVGARSTRAFGGGATTTPKPMIKHTAQRQRDQRRVRGVVVVGGATSRAIATGAVVGDEDGARADARKQRREGTTLKTMVNEKKNAIEDEAKSWWDRASRVVGASALALALAVTATMMTPDAALAARSGGRMGGGSFRASSMSSYRAPSRSFGSSGSSFSSYSAPSVATGAGVTTAGAPLRTSGFFLAPMFGYGFGMPMFFGGGFFNLMLVFMLISFLTNTMQNLTGGGFGDGMVAGGDTISVVKIQVGLIGSARALQKDLERIADRADTSSPDGLHYVLEETVLALLRNPEYCVYGYATSKACRGPEQAEETFNDYSIDERGKFEKETLVNVNSRKRTASAGSVAGEDTNDYILVTIIAACDGGVKMPEITGAPDIKTALKRLGAVRVEALQAVEVLWTPQEDGDTLTATEMLRDYPLLVNL
jgi:uncharacterized membrane protein